MKNNLRRLFALVMVVVLAFCIVGCGGGDVSSTGSDNPADVSSDSASDVSSDNTTSTGDTTTSSKPNSNNQGTTSEEDTVVYEKPNAGNDSVMFNKQSSKYDSQADTLRKKIINAKDSGLKGTTVYYVSYKGNDFNDGLTPNTAWQTLAMASTVNENSIVLFERGGVYRGSLQVKSNCSYGAYGSGSKPCLYGSSQNYADTSLWKESKKRPGTWEISVNEKDVGQIVFDHGKQVATKVPVGATEAKEYNYVLSGGKIYLYISENPAKRHKDIEISGYNHVVYSKSTGAKNIYIENLCVKYGSRHGMSFSFTENITVKNCEIGYIGGAGGSVPLGNGIEFWLDTKNVTVENCWVYQCFDAGLTNQGQRNDGKPNVQEGITFKNNLIEYCIYGIEYFAGQGTAGSTIKDTTYTGNIIRFSGMGWSKPGTRVGETFSSSSVSAINGWGTNLGVGKFPASNFVIENNILDTSWKFLINVVEPNADGRVTVRNNTYYQQKSDTASIWYDNSKQIVRAENLQQMIDEIKKIDLSPKAVELK